MCFIPSDILIPMCDLSKWAVIACDQFTSEPQYWDDVKRAAGDGPSALNVILPEVYLDDEAGRIGQVSRNMRSYLDGGLFSEYRDCYIFVVRTLRTGIKRLGLVGACDLTKYDYAPGNRAMIRATEGTVLERIPPRVEVRKNAPLELPHIMLLVNDIKNVLFDELVSLPLEKIYDFELMMDGGHIEGYLCGGGHAVRVREILNEYAGSCEDGFAFAVGDGNHSLAAAKSCIGEKSRYCLAELVNIYDTSLEFHAIHRALFDCNIPKVISDLSAEFGKGSGIIYITGTERGGLKVDEPLKFLKFLDKYASAENIRIDFIHGEESVGTCVNSGDNNIGFILPSMKKEELFPWVAREGVLPRKTFSMGEAYDKRYYLEARAIGAETK